MDDEKLCVLCKGITFDALGSRHGYVHCSKAQLVQFEAERKDGCPMCALIWWSLRYDHHRIFKYSQIRLYLNPPQRLSSRPLYRIEVFVAVRADDTLNELGWAFKGEGKWELGPPDPFKFIRSHLKLYGIRGDPTEKVFHNKLTDRDPNSNQNIQLVLEWLETCLKYHTNCAKNTESNLPTRVIDVGPADGSSQPFLMIPSEHHSLTRNGLDSVSSKRGKYMALSYCWGTEPFLNTTLSTINERKRGFAMDDLPQTIRDSVIIARRLNIPYLWVDALCIIQGEDKAAQDDWKRESTRMKNIFSGAFLTISAASAKSAYHGILQKRQWQSFPHCRLTYNSCKDPGICGSVSVGPDHLACHESTEPLGRRAWALQEYFLSTRVLTYGTSELSWKCNCAYIKENEPTLPPVLDEAIKSPEEIGWPQIVEDYCSRELTRNMDKLPALSGLVEALREVSGDKYVAGLWMSKLCSQLLWRRCELLVKGRREYSQSSKYRAPSWSWASVDGRIKFHDLNAITQCKARVIRCSTSSSASHGLGLVSSGKLIISGFMKNMPTIRCMPSASYHGGYENYLPWMRIHDGVKTFLDDVDSLRGRSRKITGGNSRELLDSWFFWVGVGDGRRVEYKKGAGLILQANNHLPSLCPVFKRVGMFTWEDHITELKEKGTWRTIVIT